MSKAVQTPRLNVVTLGVNDFARSVRFYQDLGFERRSKATGADGRVGLPE